MTYLELQQLLLELGIGNEDFFQFMQGKVKSYNLGTYDFPWGVFQELIMQVF